MLHVVSSCLRNNGRIAVLALALLLAGPGAARATVWLAGDLTTYTQDNWGGNLATDAGAALLVAKYDTVYASTFGLLTVGSPSGFTLTVTDAASVIAYLPAIGPFAALNGSIVDPITTSSGAFGGEVLALQLNVDFSDAGLLPAASGLPFGGLILGNFTTGPDVALNGLTVRQFLDDLNTLLGGGSSIISIADLGTIVGDLNASFSAGQPSQFAQEHLIAPTTPAVPEPSSLLVLAVGLAGMELFRRRRKAA